MTHMDGRRRTGEVGVWAVLVCGLGAYLFSFGSSGGAEWAVRFSVLAAAVAAVGLLAPRHTQLPAMAVLAAVGFADALAQWVTASEAGGWAVVLIVVLTGLQMLSAFAALVCDSGALDADDRDQAAYDPYAYYAYYARAAQHSHAEQRAQEPEELEQAGSAEAQAVGSAQAYEAAAQRYAQYAAYWDDSAHASSRPAATSQQGEPSTSVAATGPAGSGPNRRTAVGSPTQSAVQPPATGPLG